MWPCRVLRKHLPSPTQEFIELKKNLDSLQSIKVGFSLGLGVNNTNPTQLIIDDDDDDDDDDDQDREDEADPADDIENENEIIDEDDDDDARALASSSTTLSTFDPSTDVSLRPHQTHQLLQHASNPLQSSSKSLDPSPASFGVTPALEKADSPPDSRVAFSSSAQMDVEQSGNSTLMDHDNFSSSSYQERTNFSPYLLNPYRLTPSHMPQKCTNGAVKKSRLPIRHPCTQLQSSKALKYYRAPKPPTTKFTTRTAPWTLGPLSSEASRLRPSTTTSLRPSLSRNQAQIATRYQPQHSLRPLTTSYPFGPSLHRNQSLSERTLPIVGTRRTFRPLPNQPLGTLKRHRKSTPLSSTPP